MKLPEKNKYFSVLSLCVCVCICCGGGRRVRWKDDREHRGRQAITDVEKLKWVNINREDFCISFPYLKEVFYTLKKLTLSYRMQDFRDPFDLACLFCCVKCSLSLSLNESG